MAADSRALGRSTGPVIDRGNASLIHGNSGMDQKMGLEGNTEKTGGRWGEGEIRR
jgi:hypothetical protein